MESLELENTDGLLKIRCTDPQGGLWERSVAVRSQEVAP